MSEIPNPPLPGQPLPFDIIETQLKFLMGEILTVADAVFSDKEQRKAVKDLIRHQFHRRLQWFNELCYGPPGPNTSSADKPHPEESCQKCGRANVVWFTDSPHWNEVVRLHHEREILCPICFIELAAKHGYFSGAWSVQPRNLGKSSGKE